MIPSSDVAPGLQAIQQLTRMWRPSAIAAAQKACPAVCCPHGANDDLAVHLTVASAVVLGRAQCLAEFLALCSNCDSCSVSRLVSLRGMLLQLYRSCCQQRMHGHHRSPQVWVTA